MEYPLIDITATGSNLARLRAESGITVRALSDYLGMNNTNSIYRWFRGESLPSLDNLYAISVLLGVSMNEIIVKAA
ncbi:MAG: helix-turn-helix domain-containing protein [Lachnospiraceae bacterium]|nr:helix-turn-helix domain-containing protein [Lachnospiraceae bacterium]